jgi:hypothetical protein
MIQITRALARQIRTVLRKAAPLGSERSYRPSLSLHAGPNGMQIRGHHEEVAVELHLPGPCSSDTIVLSHATLEDIQSRQDSLVTITAKNAECVQTRWEDRGVAQGRDYDTVGIDRLPPFPVEPKRFAALD